ncbi:exported hypothetical protein [Paraburkholderia piptadeniae]|uniref:Porin domain-containing protein n=1 Tax=Paraburkholderia piptadeniae TaxID=1701573 RepID=A0A1N7SN40_9BURK|nr:exported hypothetical protein [Paraburkholderia piptadeniae]
MRENGKVSEFRMSRICAGVAFCAFGMSIAHAQSSITLGGPLDEGVAFYSNSNGKRVARCRTRPSSRQSSFSVVVKTLVAGCARCSVSTR